MNSQSVTTGSQGRSAGELDSARAGVSQLSNDEMMREVLSSEEETGRLTIRVPRLGVVADKKQRTKWKSPASRSRVVGDGMVGSVDEISRENVSARQTVFMSSVGPKSHRARFRGSVVALKPGKPGGAKGPRKVEIDTTV